MTSRPVSDPGNEEFWRDFLTRGDPRERAQRKIFQRLPHGPRCQMCAAPFAGLGAPVMRMIGKRRSETSPQMCNSCFAFMSQHHGGAEIEASFLFADVRGSTALAERMSTSEFHRLMNRYYTAAAQVVFDHSGSVDKFVGDELVAFFLPLLSGDSHPRHAVDAARALLRATGHEEPGGPWVPVGAAVHTGRAWFGAVGDGGRTELTALGDAVNTTARLASAAGRGEVLVTAAAAEAAGLDPALDRRQLELRGKEGHTEVVALMVGQPD
jgi:adenylate cyclase